MATPDNTTNVVGRFDFPKSAELNNIRFSFDYSEEAVEEALNALAGLELPGWDQEELVKRNIYGRNGKPFDVKMQEALALVEKLQAEKAAMDAAAAEQAKTDQADAAKAEKENKSTASAKSS